MSKVETPGPPGCEPALRTIAMPADANANGDIFGGWVLSQMDLAGGSLAVPLVLLYEASILSAKWVERQRAKREAEEEAELGGSGGPAPGE